MNNEHAAIFIPQAVAYLEECKKQSGGDRYANVLRVPVADALISFCEQDGEFAQAVAQMQAVESAPEQIDMTDYISRTDADNARIAAVDAARKESADALAKAQDAAEKAKAAAEELKAELESAAASGKAEAEKAYSEALHAAEERARALEEKLQTAAAPVVQKFAIYFESLQGDFNKIADLLLVAEEADAARMRAGLRKVLAAMSEAIGEE